MNRAPQHSAAPTGYATSVDQVRLHEFYSGLRNDHSEESRPESLYEIWERGGAFHDSITPSTYCRDYREHMVSQIRKIARPDARLFSIGCGNAFVEADLAAAGMKVHAIDCNPEAVVLANKKGVIAAAGDYMTMPEESFLNIDVVYGDGFLGHAYDSDAGLDRFFDQLARLSPPSDCALVFSNDAPLDSDKLVEPHATAPNFWMLSREFVEAAMKKHGYDVTESYYFAYQRPVSGKRNRTVCISRGRI